MRSKAAKLLKDVAFRCFSGSKMFLTLSEDCETNLLSALENWASFIGSWAGFGAMLMGGPYIFAMVAWIDYGIRSAIWVLAVYFGAPVAVILACALACAVPALVCLLASVLVEICTLSIEKIKMYTPEQIYHRINVDSRVSEILQLSTKDLKYIKNHPEIMEAEILEKLRKGAIKLSLPDNVEFDEKFWAKFMKNGKKCAEKYCYESGYHHYTDTRLAKCNWDSCDDVDCQLSCKALKRRKEDAEKKKEATIVAKNAAVEKVYFNKYMAQMGR